MLISSTIDAKQIKAARALLDWSREDLALYADVSVGTVSSVESGFIPKTTTLQKICETINNAGVEMTNGGVLRRPNGIHMYEGTDSCDKFFASVEKVSENYNGDVLVFIFSEELWLNPCGYSGESNLTRLENLRGITGIKCFLLPDIKLESKASRIQFLRLPETALALMPSCAIIHGNRYAMMWAQNRATMTIAEFNIPMVALSYRKDFMLLWSKFSSLKTEPSRSRLRGVD